MAKPTRIASKQSVQKRAESAYDILTNEAVHWDTLRSRVRSKLSGLLLPADDLIRGHGTDSLYLLAALWNVSKQQTPLVTFSDILIRSFVPERDSESLRKMFPRHVLDMAYAISINDDQALIVLNQNLGDLLSGERSERTRYKYSTLPIGEAIPNFWSDVHGVIGNIAWNAYSQTRYEDEDYKILTSTSLKQHLAKAVSQYFATNGLRSCLKVDNIDALSGVNVYIALTDNEQLITSTRIDLFAGCISASSDISNNISFQAQEVCDTNDWSVQELFVLSDNARVKGPEIRRVVSKQNKQGFPLPITLQFTDASEASESLFRNVDEVESIGWGISFREEALGLRELSDRERLELSAAIYEIAITDVPPEEAQPAPAKGKPAKRRKALSVEEERKEIIDQIVRLDIMSRRNAERASTASLRKRLEDYNLFDDENEDEDDE